MSRASIKGTTSWNDTLVARQVAGLDIPADAPRVPSTEYIEDNSALARWLDDGGQLLRGAPSQGTPRRIMLRW